MYFLLEAAQACTWCSRSFIRTSLFCGTLHWRRWRLTSPPLTLPLPLVKTSYHWEGNFRNAGKRIQVAPYQAPGRRRWCLPRNTMALFVSVLIIANSYEMTRKDACPTLHTYRRRFRHTSGSPIVFFPGMKMWILAVPNVWSCEITNCIYNTGRTLRIQRNAFWAL